MMGRANDPADTHKFLASRVRMKTYQEEDAAKEVVGDRLRERRAG
jgi:hypothetical protein